MATYNVQEASLTAVADAIRAKTGGTDELVFPGEFVSEIGKICGIEDYVGNRSNITGDIVITATQASDRNALSKTNITSIKAPNMTNPGTSFCDSCTLLKTAEFPAITNANNTYYLFHNCTSLESFSLPNLSTGNLTYFARYATMEYVVLPKFTGTVSSNAFRNCPNLLAFDAKTTIISSADNFRDAPKLKIVILRGSLCALQGLNTFLGTPFASGGTGGILYVPQALISDYQSETNWSTILSYENNQILPIEGSIYETQYADGTPISS